MHKHEKRPHGIQGPVGHKGPSSAESCMTSWESKLLTKIGSRGCVNTDLRTAKTLAHF